jgi:hypothetical protein
MSELVDTDGYLIRLIMGNRDIRRVDPHIPVWEIKGSGQEFEQRRRRLLERILKDFPRSILRYAQNDADIEKLEGGWERVAPSLWIVPGVVDIDELYNVLWHAEWGLYPISRDRKPVVLGFEEHGRRLAWMRFTNVPLVLENHHWRDAWLVTINPDSVPELDRDELISLDFDSTYPELARVLDVWVGDPSEQDEREKLSLVNWLAWMVREDDRHLIMDQGEKVLGERAFPLEDIERKAGRKFAGVAEARGWLRRVIDTFGTVENNRREEEKLLGLLRTLLQEFSMDLYNKGMAAKLEGIVVRSRVPYESEARIRIQFHEDGQPGTINESHIEMIFVPLFVQGMRLSDRMIRERAAKELGLSVAMGPYVKLYDFYFKGRAAMPVAWPIFMILVIFLLAWALVSLPFLLHGC